MRYFRENVVVIFVGSKLNDDEVTNQDLSWGKDIDPTNCMIINRHAKKIKTSNSV
jgi:hypothetical protein